jgi:hypothetical protein
MMSVVLAEKRISDFERKYGEVALQLAYHAALPVALNTDLLHLLRINFFIDPPKSLPYTAEFELLLSPLCREIDEGLYEIEPEIRDILLRGLYSIDLGQRVKDVATLLWQYIDRDAVWIDRVELERAQQLTVLNFLDPAGAKDYLAEGEAESDAGQIAARDWYVAMHQELDRNLTINDIRTSEIAKMSQSLIPKSLLGSEYNLPSLYSSILNPTASLGTARISEIAKMSQSLIPKSLLGSEYNLPSLSSSVLNFTASLGTARTSEIAKMSQSLISKSLLGSEYNSLGLSSSILNSTVSLGTARTSEIAKMSQSLISKSLLGSEYDSLGLSSSILNHYLDQSTIR